MAVPAPDAHAAPGGSRVFGGRYRLGRYIAKGGMAEVWEGHDEVLSRPVAVKVLLAHLASDDTVLERFRREAVTAARLAHPGVVATYDTGADHGTAWIVMELVRGRTLRHLISERGVLEPALAVSIAGQITDALAHAHRAGLVHRDIKPANVLLCDDEGSFPRAKVTDFGIAKATEGLGLDLTRTGIVLGTPKYLSPEQVEGTEPDARADLYALGVVLFEMLTGRPPFSGTTDMATALSHLRDTPARVAQLRPEVPAELDGIVAELLIKDRDERTPSAAALRRELAAAARHLGTGTSSRRLGGGPTTSVSVPRVQGEAPRVAPSTAATQAGGSPSGGEVRPSGRGWPPGPLEPAARSGWPSEPPAPIPWGAPAPVGHQEPAEGLAGVQPTTVIAGGVGGAAGGGVGGGVGGTTEPLGRPPGFATGPSAAAWERTRADRNGTLPDGAAATRQGSTWGVGTPPSATRGDAAARTRVEAAWPAGPGSARPEPAAVATGASPEAVSGPADRPRGRRGPGILVAALVITGVVVAAVLFGQAHNGGGSLGGDQGVSSGPLTITQANEYVLNGHDADDPTRLGNLFDGNPATSWSTAHYATRTFGGYYPGLGVVLELNATHTVHQMTVTSSTTGWSAEAYVSRSAPGPAGTSVAPWGKPTGSVQQVSDTATLSLGGHAARYVMLWLTNLGPSQSVRIDEVGIR